MRMCALPIPPLCALMGVFSECGLTQVELERANSSGLKWTEVETAGGDGERGREFLESWKIFRGRWRIAYSCGESRRAGTAGTEGREASEGKRGRQENRGQEDGAGGFAILDLWARDWSLAKTAAEGKRWDRLRQGLHVIGQPFHGRTQLVRSVAGGSGAVTLNSRPSTLDPPLWTSTWTTGGRRCGMSPRRTGLPRCGRRLKLLQRIEGKVLPRTSSRHDQLATPDRK